MHSGSLNVSGQNSTPGTDGGLVGTFRTISSSPNIATVEQQETTIQPHLQQPTQQQQQQQQQQDHAMADNGALDAENPTQNNANGISEDVRRSQVSNTSSEDDDDDIEEEPVWLCKMIVRHPKKAFATFLAMHLGSMVLIGVLTVAGYDAIPMDFQNAPFYLETDWTHLRVMAWVYRDDDTNVILPNVLDVQDVAERSVKEEGYIAYYDGGSNNVFTQTNLKAIEEAEDKIVSVDDYHKFCYANDTGGCQRPISIIRFFDGTFGTAFNDPNYENIPGILAAALAFPMTKEILQFHLGKDYHINQTIAFSPVTRTLFRIGFPLPGFESPKKDEEEQEDKRSDFLGNEMIDFFEGLAEDGVGNMNFLYNSISILQAAIERSVIQDLALAMGSLAFIFLFVCFQTRSLFITALAVASIFTSFCATNLVYRIVFDYRYFGIFHVLSIFIILGIGADNVFIFYDTWRQSNFKQYSSLEHRLSDCYRRSASSMLITSLTTMIAFFANAFSPLLMVSTFGLFSGLLIFINYLSVITYFPCVVIIYHLKFEKWQWPCCRCCNTKSKPVSKPPTFSDKPQNVSTVMTIDNQQSSPGSPRSPTGSLRRRKSSVVYNWDPSVQTVAEGRNEKGERPNIIVRFFSGPYYKFITNKVIRWIIVILYLGMIGFFVYQATRIQVSKEALRIFKDDSNFQKAADLDLEEFLPSSEDNNVKVYISWGLKEQDRSECHKTDFGCKGENVWDDSFDLNPPPAQLALLDFCHKLRNLPEDQLEELHIRKNVEGKVEIKCFVENMDAYLQKTMNISLPATAAKVQKLMMAEQDLYNMTIFPDRYYRYFEVALDYWLSDGFKGRNYDYEEYFPLIGMSRDADTRTMAINDTEYLFGTRLRYAAIVVNTTLDYRATGYEEGIPIMDAWEDFVHEEVKQVFPSLSSGVQFTPELLDPDEWQWLKIQKVLVRSAWQGIGIGLAFALPIFILATRNWILGILATLNITIITFSVVGMITVLGWELGALESLNMSLVVGLAIDYVVHLVEGYHFSTKKDRLGKTHDMLSEVGVSVVSGACTTLGASFFMLFTVLMFFTQFGIFMFCTIGFSLVYSLGLFCTVLGIMGPEGDTGSIMPLYYAIKRYITGRKKTDVDCQICDGRGFYSRRKSMRLLTHY